MPNNPMSKSGGQPLATPMPTQATAAKDASAARQQKVPNELIKVGPMDNYPSGRGGMRMVPMAPAQQVTKTDIKPSAPIGAQPAASKMPGSS
jgi:hypothetical protein